MMRTDGLFTIHAATVKIRSLAEPITLVPFGDIHHDSPAHADETFDEFIRWAKKLKNPVFLGMGDYLDSYSTSERLIIGSDGLHDSTRKRNERDTMKRIDALGKRLSFMRGRVIGLLGGNHYPMFSDGTTGDMHLAKMLDARYLGVCSAIRLTVSRANRRATVDIFAHHGKGGGTTAGGKMNAVEKLTGVCEADIFLMGDNHARGALPIGDKLRLMQTKCGLRLRSRRAWIGRTGSFLKSYEPDEASYVTDRALPPASLGWISFNIRMRTPKDGQIELDIKGEQ